MVMGYMHTAQKAARIVVFFTKKIWAHIVMSIAAYGHELQKSFSKREVRPGRIVGFWYEENQVNPKYLPQGLEIGLICAPEPGINRGLLWALKRAFNPQCFTITRLEALYPLLKAYAQEKHSDGAVLIANLSQMSSVAEQEGRFLERKTLRAHQRALIQALNDIHALSQNSGLNIIICDHYELFGRKNSALFERLFVSQWPKKS